VLLQDAINSASSLTQTLSGELADGQRQLLAMAAAGANSKVGDPSTKLGNGPLPGMHEMVCPFRLLCGFFFFFLMCVE
jgi:enhancer of mRNA-decapping protein 4